MARKTTKRKRTTTPKTAGAKAVTTKTKAVETSVPETEPTEVNEMVDVTETPEVIETEAEAVTDTVSEDGAAPENVVLVKAMGKRELIDRVVEISGIKKKAAKPVVEAVLKELGDALHRGENLNLQPFGKGIVKSRKELENAEIVELRLRRSKLAITAAEAAFDGSDESNDDTGDGPLAEAAE